LVLGLLAGSTQRESGLRRKEVQLGDEEPVNCK
jgi:hypothetical protein